MERIIIIHRPSRLESLISRFNTKQQAKFYVEHIKGDFADYELEHATFDAARSELVRCAERLGRVQEVDWKYLPSFLFRDQDLVLTIGQDGLVANTLKYLTSQTVLGFNPDQARWDGVLSQFSVKEASVVIPSALAGKIKVELVTKAIVRLSDRQNLLAVNDFFIGVRNHTSARYLIRYGGDQELQSSSGVVVSTPLGSTAWMRSILLGATSISSKLSSSKLSLRAKRPTEWARDRLTFAVREPFPSVSTSTSIIFGAVTPRSELVIESRMGEGGIIFSDGVDQDFLEFNHSVVASFGLAAEKGRVAVRQ